MNRKRLLKHLVFLMFFIFLAQVAGEKFHWDSLLWYFDIITHFLGGFWVGMFFLYVLTRKKEATSLKPLFIKVFLYTLTIGILWEFYEVYIYQYISLMPFDLEDSSTDLLLDLLGSFLSVLFYAKIIMLRPANKVQSS